MKKRKSEPKPKSAAKKKKQNNKNNKNTLPPNHQNRIWQYLRNNKNEETNINNKIKIEITTKQDKLTQDNKNQNNEKPTFKVMAKPAVGDKIRKFQELSNKNNQCVIGSGRCGSHNMKLVREIKQKKNECYCQKW